MKKSDYILLQTKLDPFTAKRLRIQNICTDFGCTLLDPSAMHGNLFHINYHAEVVVNVLIHRQVLETKPLKYIASRVATIVEAVDNVVYDPDLAPQQKGEKINQIEGFYSELFDKS